jgi:ERF superfamily
MPHHKSLLEALLAFQAEVPTLPKDATNPHFKSRFTPLDTIVEKVGPILAKHGLVWMACPTYGPDGNPALSYQLAHAASKEHIDGTMPLLLSKSDPQGQGSAITYARRYSLCAVLNLVADDDDDGNAAVKARQQEPAKKPQMTAKAKALLKEATEVYAKVGEERLPEARFQAFVQSTGGTEEGLQRMVDWLREQVPAGDAA